jgi:hypothetical protein
MKKCCDCGTIEEVSGDGCCDCGCGCFEEVSDVDRGFLEGCFGTNPELEDLKNARNLIDEWICELEANTK